MSNKYDEDLGIEFESDGDENETASFLDTDSDDSEFFNENPKKKSISLKNLGKKKSRNWSDVKDISEGDSGYIELVEVETESDEALHFEDDTASTPREEDDADRAFAAKERRRKISNIINRAVLIIAACVFIFAAYKLISILLMYKKGNDEYNKIESSVLSDDNPVVISIGDGEEVEIPFSYNHQSLLEINSEGLGFLYIPSLDVRLPIAQTSDNDFYLTHTFNRTYNGNGCLFLDYRIADGINSSNLIIYGHSMNSGAMFGTLYKYKSYYFWNTDGNDVFYIYTGNEIREYRIFSVYVSEPISDTYEFNFSTNEELQEYAAKMQALSSYSTGVDVSKATQVVTFSTCTNDGEQRLIVHGVLTGKAQLNDDGTDNLGK